MACAGSLTGSISAKDPFALPVTAKMTGIWVRDVRCGKKVAEMRPSRTLKALLGACCVPLLLK